MALNHVVLGFDRIMLEVSVANCVECGKKFGFLEAGAGGLCGRCNLAAQGSLISAEASEQRMIVDEQTQQAAVNAILLTTETAPNLNITKRIEIVTAECAFGMNIFKDLFAGVRNKVMAFLEDQRPRSCWSRMFK